MPTAVSFGGVTVGTSGSSSLLLTNTGTAALNISQVGVSGSGFGWGGFALPLTLAAGQSTTLTVTFSPASAGNVTGSLSIVNDGTGSPATLALSGTGIQPSSRINLAWDASVSVVVGYYVFRGAQAGGPYTRLNTSPVAGLAYADQTVTSGTTYYYVVTAVDANGFESGYSNEVSARAP